MADTQSLTNHLITIRDYIRYAYTQFNRADIFYGHGTDNAWDEAVFLVARTLSLPWDIDADLLDARLVPEEKEEILRRISLRVDKRMPLPYLLGEALFMGLSFKVNDHVLIPRSPIAELIENGFAPWVVHEDVNRILDLCTGSGCIGIAAAFEFPAATVDLSDLSADALEIASENIQAHQLQDRVSVIQSDVFENIEGRYDIIVTNPPYVDAGDMHSMPDEFRHEPEMALACGEDGLDIVRVILREAREYLTENGILVVEVGNSWMALEALFPDIIFNWVEFEHGGGGVFIMMAEELDLYADLFVS
ncbi:MAG: 50S ribosomal protein L3 N(5)-glutamine methyltransferase [Hahellaceae bacterium]|nr:50S ribosomal protein L3 N(5)-glutamine methyltransferase [Hahellaceae bacterium]